jgi:hypothetical protein
LCLFSRAFLVRFFTELEKRKWPRFRRQPPTYYEELYVDRASNPFVTDDKRVILCYSEVNEMWRSTHNNPLSVLWPNFTNTFYILADLSRPIGAIGVFVADDESDIGHLKLLHDLHNFPGPPGHSSDRMVTMGFEGDVSGLDICTLAFDLTQLAITDNVIVPGTIDRVQQLLSEEPGQYQLGPFKATDANTRTIKTRGMGYFPFEVLDPLLGAEPTAHQAFELVVPSLIDAGLDVACSGLIDFLTVALVQPNEDYEAPLTVHAQAGKAGHLPGPVVIHYRRKHTLYRDLPSLHPIATRAATSDPALIDVARGMRDMVAEARADRNDRTDNRDEPQRPNTVREKMGDTITDRLLLLCRSTYDEKLPRVYQEWAVHPRGVSERWVLQQSVEASCAVLNVTPFEVTPAQVMALNNFRLSGSTYFDIGSGLLPFSITPADATPPPKPGPCWSQIES